MAYCRHAFNRTPRGADVGIAVGADLKSPAVVAIELAHVAQLVEHTLGKGEVIGSTPIMGSKLTL